MSSEDRLYTKEMPRPPYLRDFSLILVFSLIPRLLYIHYLPEGSFSHDMIGWGVAADKLMEGQNPYPTGYLNGPPFWMQILFVLKKFALAFDISVFPVIQGFVIFCEILVMYFSYFLLKRVFFYRNSLSLILFGMSLNPVCIILICQHVQFDIIVALWVVLLITQIILFHSNGKGIHWLLACLFLGINVLTKTFPFILLPLLTYRFHSLSKKMLFLGAYLLFFPILIGLSAVYVLDPEVITQMVINYSSVPGYFGFSGFLSFLESPQHAYRIYTQVSFALLLGIMILCTRYLREARGIKKIHLVFLCCALLLSLPTFGPGYGPQYFSWYLPLLVVIYSQTKGLWRITLLLFYLVATLTYIVEYAMLSTHGAFLLKFISSPEIETYSRLLVKRTTQTIFRMPLFALYLAITLGCFWSLRIKKESHG